MGGEPHLGIHPDMTFDRLEFLSSHLGIHPNMTFDQLEFYDCKSHKTILNNLREKQKDILQSSRKIWIWEDRLKTNPGTRETIEI